jgi:glycosyltransferase involved in cell wall biosynthesis
MKIVLLLPSLDIGGSERQAVVLANGLAKRGHAVTVALFRLHGELLAELDSKVLVHGFEKKGQADIVGFLLKLRRFLKEERADVLYSFLGVPNLAGVAMKGSGLGLPVVWGVRASNMDLNHYGTLSKVCHLLERKLSCFADLVIVNSKAGRAHAIRQGFSADLLSVVHNGIDTGLFRPNNLAGADLRSEWGVTSDMILVGVVARLDPVKNHEMFLRAAKRALESGLPFHFVCVGNGPLLSKLEMLTGSLGLSAKVTWPGERIDMPAVYNALDILCLSSSSEGFPNVIGEAMACGVPCVATDVGDVQLAVGGSGMVVNVGDVEGFSSALIATSEQIRTGTSPDVRARIEELFSVERMVTVTEDCLSALVSRGG